MSEEVINIQNTDCFAYNVRHGSFYCSALNESKCTYPDCKTFKTHEQVAKEKIKTEQRLKEIRKK